MGAQAQWSGWDELAQHDPLWAIMSDPAKRGGGWRLEDFLASGEAEVARFLQWARSFGLPRQLNAALDFGCGVGRLTRPLAAHFDTCVGVDVSPEMIRLARRLHGDVQGIEWIVNDREEPVPFPDQHFDLVMSVIVLQHLPSKRLIERYLGELCRVLVPGGVLIVQVPQTIPILRRVQLRPRLYSLGRTLGFPAHLLQRASLVPITMRGLSSERVHAVVQGRSGRVAGALEERQHGGVASTSYAVTR